jgi:peroxiredoxin
MTAADQHANGNAPSNYSSNLEPSAILKPGTQAPDFTLRSTPDQTLSLSEFRGQPVVLAFYPADWSPVCGDQMTLYSEVLPELQRYNATVFGISVDGAWCHLAYRQHQKIAFPLLADFEPKGGVARQYGAYRHQDGVAERALFVLDQNGVISWSYLSPIGVNPGADGILRALESMQSSTSAGVHAAAGSSSDRHWRRSRSSNMAITSARIVEWPIRTSLKCSARSAMMCGLSSVTFR